MTYECHITCPLAFARAAQQVADLHGWSTSEIERDPLLGKDSYFYLTKHRREFITLRHDMDSAVRALRLAGVQVVREKIEHIVYDTKTGVGV